ncbi:hypothetical protein CRUP_029324 [Coryphaenoides rupestris]|nr:hypothetical protein CRUP_029324 [Coryphaenoides rupestris]
MESHMFECVNQAAVHEELEDESRRLCDVRPFLPVLKLVTRTCGRAERLLDSKIGVLIGKATTCSREVKESSSLMPISFSFTINIFCLFLAHRAPGSQPEGRRTLPMRFPGSGGAPRRRVVSPFCQHAEPYCYPYQPTACTSPRPAQLAPLSSLSHAIRSRPAGYLRPPPPLFLRLNSSPTPHPGTLSAEQPAFEPALTIPASLAIRGARSPAVPPGGRPHHRPCPGVPPRPPALPRSPAAVRSPTTAASAPRSVP